LCAANVNDFAQHKKYTHSKAILLFLILKHGRSNIIDFRV
jgi:hypothetical protein